MVINHNISALNTYNKLQANENNTTSSLEKLSSGLRINKAADDAAGLAISQKMQAQINGLDTASDNSQNGISLIQTAEGALSESQSILQRMNELAVQASNGVNGSDDVKKINDEVTQLQGSLNEISEQTTYNTKSIFSQTAGDGLFNTNGITLQVGASATDTMKIQLTGVTGVSADNLGVGATVPGTGTKEAGKISFVGANATGGTVNFEFNDGNGVDETVSATAAANASATSVAGAIYAKLNSDTNITSAYTLTNNNDGTISIAAKNDAAVAVTGTETGSVVQTAAVTVTGNRDATGAAGTTAEKNTYTVAGSSTAGGAVTFEFKDSANTIDETVSYTAAVGASATDIAAGLASALSADTNVTSKFNVTDNHDGTFTLEDKAKEVTTDTGTLGGAGSMKDATASYAQTTAGVNDKGLDFSSAKTARSTIETIKSAISTVSSLRSQLGAYQNKLTHTINNLSTESENLTAASSQITDVDMAKEMTSYTKNNILVQSAEAMLAQANQLPQGVLSLLK